MGNVSKIQIPLSDIEMKKVLSDDRFLRLFCVEMASISKSKDTAATALEFFRFLKEDKI
jgi:hypothetical protein